MLHARRAASPRLQQQSRLVVVASSAQNKPKAGKKPRQKDGALVVGLVSLLTESLRVLGVGKDRYEAVISDTKPVRRLRSGDINGVINRLKADFKRGYFITGVIDDTIYDDNCRFADPTIAFSGLQLWKRNLALLSPFLIQPSVKLTSIKRTGKNQEEQETIFAEWELSTYLSLPWTPKIAILGATEYTLNEERNQVVEHVEFWNVTGAQALAQMFRPGKPDEA